MSRSAVAGRVARARRRGDSRFPPRPSPSREETKQRRLEADRARYRREHPAAGRRVGEGAAKAGAMLIGAGVTSTDADRQAGRSGGAAAVLEAREPEAPDTEPQLGLALWELEAGMCRFAVNEVPAGKGLDLRFCGRPVAKGVYCQACSSRAFDPRGCRRTGKNFVVRDINKRL